MIHELVLGLSIILFTGLLFGKIAKVIRVPTVTGYLIGGCIIGPSILMLFFPGYGGIISEGLVSSLKIVAPIELGFIAFGVGSEFKISYFKEVGASAVVIAFLESLAAVVFIACGMLLFGFPLYFALAMGAVGGATAPAATILVVRQYKARGMLSRTVLSVVAIDDASTLIYFGVCVAVIKALLNPAGANLAWTIVKPFIEIIASLGLGALCGVLLTLGSKWFTGRGNRTSLVIGLILLQVGLQIWLESLGFSLSSLLSCMTMSALFSNIASAACEEIVPLIDRVTPPLVIIFFVISGADISVESMSLIALLVLGVYLAFRISGKILGTWAGGKISKAPPVVQKYLGYGLLPQGGIAIGLSLALMTILDPALPTIQSRGGVALDGMLVRVVVLGAVLVSEIFGPIALKVALFKSGEVPQEMMPKPRVRRKPALAAADTAIGAAVPTVEAVAAAAETAPEAAEKTPTQETQAAAPTVEE